MDFTASVLVHESAFPEAVKQQLVASLRRRELDHKFLYLGLKQTLKWLALHEALSPARLDPNCTAIYDQAFKTASRETAGDVAHLVGLGAGGGQKETRCLEILREEGKAAFFTPCDVSLEMVLTAHEHASRRLRGLQSSPIVCDLALCSTLPALLKSIDPGGATRIVSFFGMIHNFAPQEILGRILNVVRSQDLLLLSANLSPGGDYEAGLQKILPQYDNPLTEDWLISFLGELSITHADGELRFRVAEAKEPAGIKRIEANFHFSRKVSTRIHNEEIVFGAGEQIRLFYSYRYTNVQVLTILESLRLQLVGRWVVASGEEAVFLCRRSRQVIS